MVARKPPESLPPGWSEYIKVKNGRKIKHYADSKSGYVFYSKKDAMRYVETGDIGKCLRMPKKKDVASGSNDESVVVEDNLVDGLPPGWVKEIKTKVHAHGIRRDSLYVDPVSGYGFYSKKDVTRYLKTGDMGKCLTRPTKMDSASGTNDESASPLSASGDTTELSKSRKNDVLSTPSRSSKRLAGSDPEEVANLSLGERAFRVALRNSSAETKTDTSFVQTPNGPAQEVLPVMTPGGTEAKASLIPAPVISGEEGRDVMNSGGAEADVSLILAPIVSGQEGHDVVNSGGTEADPSLILAPIISGQEGREVMISGGTEAGASSVPAPINPDLETPRHIDETTKETVHTPKLEEDSQLRYPFGSCWSDPCLEFAIKTLTGAISVEDFLPYRRGTCQQQPNPPPSDQSFDLAVFDFPSQSAPPDKQASEDPLEAMKDFPAKAK